MSRIFWDTNLFIYLLENQGALAERVVELRKRMLERGDTLVTSSFTLGEILVRPLEENRPDLVEDYERLLSTGGLEMVDFDAACARIYASLRSDRALRPPDAIQLACAARSSCDLFITNDERLSRRTIPGIQFIASLERAPL